MPVLPDPVRSAEVGWKVLQWVRRVIARDHETISTGWYTHANIGNWPHIYAVAACGLSRRFRRPRRLTSSEALAFLAPMFPNSFELPASDSSSEVIAFELR